MWGVVAQNLMAFVFCLMPGEHLLTLQTDSRWWFLALSCTLIVAPSHSRYILGNGDIPIQPPPLPEEGTVPGVPTNRLLSLCRHVKISQDWKSTLESGNYCISAGKIFLLLIKVTPFFCLKFCPPFCLFLRIRLLQSVCGHTVGTLVPVDHYYLA